MSNVINTSTVSLSRGENRSRSVPVSYGCPGRASYGCPDAAGRYIEYRGQLTVRDASTNAQSAEFPHIGGGQLAATARLADNMRPWGSIGDGDGCLVLSVQRDRAVTPQDVGGSNSAKAAALDSTDALVRSNRRPGDSVRAKEVYERIKQVWISNNAESGVVGVGSDPSVPIDHATPEVPRAGEFADHRAVFHTQVSQPVGEMLRAYGKADRSRGSRKATRQNGGQCMSRSEELTEFPQVVLVFHCQDDCHSSRSGASANATVCGDKPTPVGRIRREHIERRMVQGKTGLRLTVGPHCHPSSSQDAPDTSRSDTESTGNRRCWLTAEITIYDQVFLVRAEFPHGARLPLMMQQVRPAPPLRAVGLLLVYRFIPQKPAPPPLGQQCAFRCCARTQAVVVAHCLGHVGQCTRFCSGMLKWGRTTYQESNTMSSLRFIATEGIYILGADI